MILEKERALVIMSSEIYLIDTNVLIDTLRGYTPALSFLKGLETKTISNLVTFELVQGLSSKNELKKLEEFISKFDVLNLNTEIQELGLNIYKEYKFSHEVEIIDCLIAATAIHYNLILVTKNIKHFKSIKNLKTFLPY